MIGQTVVHYKILDKLGEGGMGEVYRAHDTKLHRDVALKVLPPTLARSPERRRRFEREAAAIAALKHPNIVTIHSIEEADGVHFITMELVEGQTLAELIPEDGFSPERFLEIAEPLADALSSAHVKSIVHRDLKPANIMMDADGRLKVLDFGLAKLFESDVETDKTLGDSDTRDGQVLGTAAYMSPEQADGRPVDHRSDIFSLGVVLYEMATGERPFKGTTSLSTISSVLKDKPPSVTDIKKSFPRDLGRIINRCLEKDPERRYSSALDLRKDIHDRRAAESAAPAIVPFLRQPRIAVPMIVVLLAAAALSVWWFQRRSKVRWARQVALPEVARLLDASLWTGEGLESWDAFQLAREAERYISDDPLLQQLKRRLVGPMTIHSTPPGARVFAKPYAGPDIEWEYLGETPIDTLRYLFGTVRIKLEKDGFETVNDVYWNPFYLNNARGYVLPEVESIPEGMTLVPDSAAMLHISGAPAGLHMPGIEHLPGRRTGDFLMDRYEVTNKQYKRFVDAGGYQNRDYWKYPFVNGDHNLTWEEAKALFTDKTGRPGPATWEVGDYPDGQDDYPVTGLSWFEAAAFAEFEGKSLPTIYHWDRAALTWQSANIVPLSNFSGEGPVPVGSTDGVNRFGTQDLAGNVREWCVNESSRGGRFILGGGWNDPVYAFNDAFAQSTFDRSPINGIRCIRYLGSDANRTDLGQRVDMPFRDFLAEPGVSDETFALFLNQHDYDKKTLNAVVEQDKEDEDWVREKITFDAAYGDERMMAYLFLPRNGKPPYQTVIIFPGSGAIHTRSSERVTPPAGAVSSKERTSLSASHLQEHVRARRRPQVGLPRRNELLERARDHVAKGFEPVDRLSRDTRGHRHR